MKTEDLCKQSHPDHDSPGATFIQGSQGALKVHVSHSEMERGMHCTLPKGHDGDHRCETRSCDFQMGVVWITLHSWPTPTDGERRWSATPMIAPIPKEEVDGIVKRIGDTFWTQFSVSRSTSANGS